ncbi:MAG: hypothetical protein AAF228_11800 [Pseudomonadota bacterium]
MSKKDVYLLILAAAGLCYTYLPSDWALTATLAILFGLIASMGYDIDFLQKKNKQLEKKISNSN